MSFQCISTFILLYTSGLSDLMSRQNKFRLWLIFNSIIIMCYIYFHFHIFGVINQRLRDLCSILNIVMSHSSEMIKKKWVARIYSLITNSNTCANKSVNTHINTHGCGALPVVSHSAPIKCLWEQMSVLTLNQCWLLCVCFVCTNKTVRWMVDLQIRVQWY